MCVGLLLRERLLIAAFPLPELQKKFPGSMWRHQEVVEVLIMCSTGFYSTLAGFIEPAETFEEAVAREIYEESGIHATNITYHSCQPWVGAPIEPIALLTESSRNIALPSQSNDRVLCTSQFLRTYTDRLGWRTCRYGLDPLNFPLFSPIT
jgi:8-oxo-dGTP pyrophosphatase MutT (NUDIX family)